MDKQLWDAWLEFSAQAMKGAEDAQKAFERMAAKSFSADALSEWARQWLPEGGAGAKDLADVVEAWWKAVGGVPRSRYEEVLRQNEQLWQRLKEAEATISRLRETLVRDVTQKTQEQTEALLDEWEKTTRQVMETQAEIARKWSEGLFGAETDEKK